MESTSSEALASTSLRRALLLVMTASQLDKEFNNPRDVDMDAVNERIAALKPAGGAPPEMDEVDFIPVDPKATVVDAKTCFLAIGAEYGEGFESFGHVGPLKRGQFKQKVSVLDKSGKPILTATDSSNPWWALLEDAVKKANGKLGKPEIFPASTDARYFRNLGLPAIGFSPMANTPILLHNHNEFLNKDEYLKGIDIYESIITAYASYVDHGKSASSRDEL
nr:uncharacterized protein LOC103440951 [Malus domestica]